MHETGPEIIKVGYEIPAFLSHWFPWYRPDPVDHDPGRLSHRV